MKEMPISRICTLFGVSRQKYYRQIKSEVRYRTKAEAAVQLVSDIRMTMPRIGTRKLHSMLSEELATLGVGRDRLFSILKANHMLIAPIRSYLINKTYISSFNIFKAFVPCSRYALIFLMNYKNSLILQSILITQLSTMIRGTVIYQNNL